MTDINLSILSPIISLSTKYPYQSICFIVGVVGGYSMRVYRDRITDIISRLISCLRCDRRYEIVA